MNNRNRLHHQIKKNWSSASTFEVPAILHSNIGKHPENHNENTQNCTNVGIECWIALKFFQGFPDRFFQRFDNLQARPKRSIGLHSPAHAIIHIQRHKQKDEIVHKFSYFFHRKQPEKTRCPNPINKCKPTRNTHPTPQLVVLAFHISSPLAPSHNKRWHVDPAWPQGPIFFLPLRLVTGVGPFFLGHQRLGNGPSHPLPGDALAENPAVSIGQFPGRMFKKGEA